MKASSDVRPPSAQDTAACLAVYRAYVQNTAISWEGMARPVWAAIELYGQPSKRLAAFQWATETGSRHPPSPRRRRTRLYTRLLRRLTERGHPSIHRGYPRRDLPGTVGQDDRLARPCPPPQLTCKPLRIRKDVRPAERGRTKVGLWTSLSIKNTL